MTTLPIVLDASITLFPLINSEIGEQAEKILQALQAKNVTIQRWAVRRLMKIK